MERTVKAEIILNALSEGNAEPMSMAQLVERVAEHADAAGATASVIKGSILPLVFTDRVKLTPERKLYIPK